MPITRRNVDFAHAIAKPRDNKNYGYGGTWHPTNIWRTTDCSGIVTHMLDAVLNGERMSWSRHGLSTEAYRYVGGPGSKGPFGTIRVGRPQDIPAGAVLKIGLQHGPGGGRNSHMACTLEGIAIESSGSYGQQYGGPARGYNHSMFRDWFYLPGTVDGKPTPYVPPQPGSVLFLRFGDKGPAVLRLQQRLNRDYELYSDLDEDGEWGSQTEWVVREFQRRSGLVVDGIAGPATHAALGLPTS